MKNVFYFILFYVFELESPQTYQSQTWWPTSILLSAIVELIFFNFVSASWKR